MRIHGNLTRWNDDRGFGFITTPKGEEIFVHISAFPRGDRPQLGELISFETEVDDRNRTRAIRVMRPGGRPPPRPERHERSGRHERAPRTLRRSRGSWLTLVAVAGLAAYGYSRFADYKNYPASQAPPMTLTEDIPVERATPAPAFKCDGRTRCPQMRSCEEATFFLQSCPGTEMDGDNDGIPCEGQWCGH
jgi:cold shock CspA family protein